jgi:hypothetical protein
MAGGLPRHGFAWNAMAASVAMGNCHNWKSAAGILNLHYHKVIMLYDLMQDSSLTYTGK